MRALIVTLAATAVMAGCGGAQTPPTPPPAAAAPVAAPTPAPVASAPAAPTGPDRSGLLWYVYWEGIHCLTVYPAPGLVRSEEPNNAVPTFRSRSPYFSIISVYFEHEDEWAPVIDAATSLDDLLARLAELDQVEVEEALNPVQTFGE
ncbi:MAG: hypothetical protein H6698_00925 [Myxococcales bacterium]|nr:hypothetical protein [Myxococcales bacterium]MCB9530954.1 hypothetical protein [Myxococcales bacterium]MCB9532874.1 hypothetical protein [Myxococcales bacterium]